MKKLMNLFYRLTMKDFDMKLQSAKVTTKMIVDSTNGRVSHFYNEQGVQVRGWQPPTYKFSNVHPLVAKYK